MELKTALKGLLDVIERDSKGMSYPMSIIQIRKEAAVKALMKSEGKEG